MKPEAIEKIIASAIRKAKKNVPEGYEIVETGVLQKGDLTWHPKPFGDEFKPSSRYGDPVNSFYCVIRLIKKNERT